jgi:predicted transcriptional regulator
MPLSNTEEQLMKHLWELEPCFMKDLLEALPDPKPAKTTVATLIRRMTDKGVVAFRQRGNSREYYSLISKKAYFGKQVKGMITDFFADSPTAFASLFTDGADLTREQLEELQQMIDDQLKDKK